MQIFCTFLFREKWQNCENLWSGFQPLLASSKLQIRPCVKAYENVKKHIHRGRLCIPSKKNVELKILLCCSIWTKTFFQIYKTSHNPVSTLLSFFPWHFAHASISCSKTSLAAYQLTNPWPLRQAPLLTCLPTHAINTCMRSCVIPKQHCNRWDCKRKDTILRKAAPYKFKHYYSDY